MWLCSPRYISQDGHKLRAKLYSSATQYRIHTRYKLDSSGAEHVSAAVPLSLHQLALFLAQQMLQMRHAKAGSDFGMHRKDKRKPRTATKGKGKAPDHGFSARSELT